MSNRSEAALQAVASDACIRVPVPARAGGPGARLVDTFGNLQARSRDEVAATLDLIGATLKPVRRVVHAGDVIFRHGDVCDSLHLVNAGFFKIVTSLDDGQEQVVAFKFRGDWLGLDAISQRRHYSNAVAKDVGEVWSIRYESLLAACAAAPALLNVLHDAMSREIARHRNSLMLVCSRAADARLADFLYSWAQSMAERGMRHDEFGLRVSRAEIASYLGLKLETVSRGFGRLAREGLIEFAEGDRREIRISSIEALAQFAMRASGVAPVLQ